MPIPSAKIDANKNSFLMYHSPQIRRAVAMLLQADDVDNGAFWVRSNVTLAG